MDINQREFVRSIVAASVLRRVITLLLLLILFVAIAGGIMVLLSSATGCSDGVHNTEATTTTAGNAETKLPPKCETLSAWIHSSWTDEHLIAEAGQPAKSQQAWIVLWPGESAKFLLVYNYTCICGGSNNLWHENTVHVHLDPANRTILGWRFDQGLDSPWCRRS